MSAGTFVFLLEYRLISKYAVPNKCLDGTVVNDVDVLWFFAGSTLMSLNFYTDLIRPTLILENSIRNIHQAFFQNTSNSIRKRLMDPKKFLNFHTEGDQGSLRVFRGPQPWHRVP